MTRRKARVKTPPKRGDRVTCDGMMGTVDEVLSVQFTVVWDSKHWPEFVMLNEEWELL